MATFNNPNTFDALVFALPELRALIFSYLLVPAVHRCCKCKEACLLNLRHVLTERKPYFVIDVDRAVCAQCYGRMPQAPYKRRLAWHSKNKKIKQK